MAIAFSSGVLGDHPAIQGPGRRVALQSRQRGHPQVAAHQVVAARAHDVAPRGPRLSVAIDPTAGLNGHHPEVGHQFARGGEPVDVEDESGEHRGADFPDAGDGIEVMGLRQGPIGFDQQRLGESLQVGQPRSRYLLAECQVEISQSG